MQQMNKSVNAQVNIPQWKPNATYKKYQEVEINGDTYICEMESVQGVNPINSPYWKKKFRLSEMHKGELKKENTYNLDDIVSVNEDSELYISLKSNNTNPISDTSSWKLFLRAPQQIQSHTQNQQQQPPVQTPIEIIPTHAEQKNEKQIMEKNEEKDEEEEEEDDEDDDSVSDDHWHYLLLQRQKQAQDQLLQRQKQAQDQLNNRNPNDSNHFWNFLFKSTNNEAQEVQNIKCSAKKAMLHLDTGTENNEEEKKVSFVTIKFNMEVWTKTINNNNVTSNNNNSLEENATNTKKGSRKSNNNNNAKLPSMDADGILVVYLPLTNSGQTQYINEAACDFIPKYKVQNVVGTSTSKTQDTNRWQFHITLYLANPISLLLSIEQKSNSVFQVDFIPREEISNTQETNNADVFTLNFVNILYNRNSILSVQV